METQKQNTQIIMSDIGTIGETIDDVIPCIKIVLNCF